ncbi:MAG: hypothetical protein CMC84_01175 [Flavobacteriaceae bacterium]|nr:hypothetical protein [Flavobacteriaceae bacterium]|tara:strand:+ start:1640 stop:2182 length:543 start_codon:yes stop_codon:yes gene_type:complete
MKENYDKCLEMILHHEGGYVNHPKDPGGETNLGVTKRVYEVWCIEQDLFQKDMKDLQFSDVAPIYRQNYWDRCKCDSLPDGVDLCVFDMGVNAGTGRGARFLQKCVGAVSDGAIGPNTLRQVDEWIAMRGEEDLIIEYSERRRNYYKRLKTFSTFGKGWLRRVEETEIAAFKLAGVYLQN